MTNQELFSLGQRITRVVGSWEEQQTNNPKPETVPRRFLRRTALGHEVCSIYEKTAGSGVWLANRDYLGVRKDDVLPSTLEELQCFSDNCLRKRGFLLVED